MSNKDNLKIPHIELFTDGGAEPNPGKGFWHHIKT